MTDAELRLAGPDDSAFAALKAKYADVLGGAPPGLAAAGAWHGATRRCSGHVR